MKTGVKVSDAMTRNPITIEKTATIKEAAFKMLKNNVGSLIIKENNKLLGIITEKDMIDKVLANNLNAEKTMVKDIMSKEIKTISSQMDLYDAITKMRDEDVRRLPVIENDEVLGLLTEKDILKIEPSLFDVLVEKFRIKEEKTKLIGKYQEGECESCGNYSSLYEVNGQLICEVCKDSAK